MRIFYILALSIIELLDFNAKINASPPKLFYAQPSAVYDPVAGEHWFRFVGAEDHRIILQVKINGIDLMALVDTGAPSTIVSKSWAQQHGLVISRETTGSGSNGMKLRAWSSAIQSEDIGAFHQTGGEIGVADTDAFQQVGRPIDMIIGMDFLHQMISEIDFDNSALRFRLNVDHRPSGHTIPIIYSPQSDRMVARLNLDGRDIGLVRIDTGSDGSLDLLKPSSEVYPKRWKVTDLAVVGLGGVYVADYARVNNVKIGDLIMNGIPVSFNDRPAVPDEEGTIGLELLDRYNIFIDGQKGLIVLSERKNSPPRILVTNMGIQGNITNEGWTIVHVMRNSPAAAVGLKDGDRICAVDGNKLTASSDIPRGPDGSVMNIVLCDGRKIDLVRRTFY